MPDHTRPATPDPATRSGAEPPITHSVADPAATTGGPTDGTVAPAPPVPAAGRYALGVEIARGGMGAVYRATDTAFGREVAVKVLLDKYAPTSGTARRFADEARISGQLQHPNIPAVHDLGTLPDGRPFLAMKLIKGETLDDLLNARADPAADRGRFVAVFEQVCQAVAYAHAHKVIHRDLKPANVMVGAFGEVQVMDWGLAKVLGTLDAEPTDPDETASPTEVQSIRQTDSAFTQAGSVLGTPAYMPPEQAVGAIPKVDARSDVFGLGAILAVILTGKPPFVGKSAETTRLKAAQGDVEECFARLDGCGAEPELVALCKRCMSKKSEDRPANAGEVAKAVAGLRAAADERARQAEINRQRAEVQAAEQRKRRRVQLALAGVVLLVAVGGGVAAVQVQAQREQDRFAAERKRQDDLRDADEVARGRERAARAEDLVRALAVAEPGAVPVLLDELAGYRELARPHLLSLAGRPGGTRDGLHARLALLADLQADPTAVDPGFLPTLVEDAADCRPEELPLLLARLEGPIGNILVEGFGRMLDDPAAFRSRPDIRLRLAAVLARLAPDHPRWDSLAEKAADELVRLNPLVAEPFVGGLLPARRRLVVPLMARYALFRNRIESGKLAVSDLAAEATAFDVTANVLARYAAGQSKELAELALTVDGRHYPLFADAIRADRAAIVPLLKAELTRSPGPTWAVAGGGVGLAAVAGCAASAEALDPDPVLAERGKRRGHAAAVLLTLGEAEAVWPVFRFPADGDPTARSYLLARLAGIGADPAGLVRRFEAEADASARRGLLVALGDFPPELVPEREAFAAKLLTLYRGHPDSGLHGAIDWLLRQKWGKGAEVAAIDAELAAASRVRAVARGLAGLGAGPLRVGPLLPAPVVAGERDWYVNGEGQTFAVVRGPVEFTLGSPVTEPGRVAVNEPAHRKRITRTFAIATTEVTVGQFLRFRPNHDWVRRYSPGQDTPAVSVTWYEAATYCNWLSEREGIPADQWCYEPAKDGRYGEGMRMKAGHLKLTGYRLPTEAEWEFACRSGAVTARHHGRGEDLLPRYGWFVKNAEDRAWPVGQLRPNELGLFDPLGNAMEWCEDPGVRYRTAEVEDTENVLFATIDERMPRLLRGGSFGSQSVYVRSADRDTNRPGDLSFNFGFRPSRTLP